MKKREHDFFLAFWIFIYAGLLYQDTEGRRCNTPNGYVTYTYLPFCFYCTIVIQMLLSQFTEVFPLIYFLFFYCVSHNKSQKLQIPDIIL